jgi:hypothetical protein
MTSFYPYDPGVPRRLQEKRVQDIGGVGLYKRRYAVRWAYFHSQRRQLRTRRSVR